MKTKVLTTIKVIILLIVILVTTVIPSNFNILCPETVQAAQKVKLSKSKITIKEGDKTYLSLIIDGFQLIDNGYAIKWSSSDKNVVTVNKFGRIKGISKGTATISAKFEKKTYKCKVTVKPKITKPVFNANEAKSNITLTPVSADNTLYKVTSTYDLPTRVTVNYKIIDKDGVTISKSSTNVLAIPWGDTYIKIPSANNNQTIQLSYSYAYARGSSISKDNYDNLMNSIQITKFENISGKSFWGHGNTGSFMYDVYIKNTSSKKVSGSIGFLVYDDNGELLPYQANSQTSINLDPDETVKQTIEVLQEVKDIDHPFDGMVNVGDIKFYISNL